jgi:hypothetical protein
MFADERVGPAAADELIERVGRIETETSLEPILRLTRSTIER